MTAGNVTRLQIRDALFAIVMAIPQSIGGAPYQLYSKRFVMPKQVPSLLPALCLRKMGETSRRQAIHRIITLEYWLYAYFQQTNPDQSVPGATVPLSAGEDVIDPMLDAVDKAFDIEDDAGTGLLTLGGLVQSVWIEGDTVLEVGDAQPEGMGFFVVPIKVDWPVPSFS